MKVSEILQNFINEQGDKPVKIGAMIHYFGDRAFGFLLLVFALICIIPLPIPGIHMFLSLPLFYLCIQQFLGRREVWFPEKVLNYEIPSSALNEISLKAMPWVKKIENISKPRLEFLVQGIGYQIFGAICFYITAFLSIPLPLTNLVPAIGISLMALGLLNRDGLALIVGSIIGIVWSSLWFIVSFMIGIGAIMLFFKQLNPFGG